MKYLFKQTFRFIQNYFPAIAKYFYIRLFFIPLVRKITKRDKRFLSESKTYTIHLQSKKVRIYEFGEGKPVLFVHGWMGKASQFHMLSKYYSSLGFKVICFDAPAHGMSGGFQTNIIEWTELMKILQNSYGGFEFAIGHSFGALALIYANSLLNLTNNIVSISAPPDSEFILNEYSKDLGANQDKAKSLIKFISKQFNFDLKELSMQELIGSQNLFVLLVHDIQDKVISYKYSQATYFNTNNTELILSEGNGHNRILYNQDIAQTINHHLNKRKELIQIPSAKSKTHKIYNP